MQSNIYTSNLQGTLHNNNDGGDQGGGANLTGCCATVNKNKNQILQCMILTVLSTKAFSAALTSITISDLFSTVLLMNIHDNITQSRRI